MACRYTCCPSKHTKEHRRSPKEAAVNHTQTLSIGASLYTLILKARCSFLTGANCCLILSKLLPVIGMAVSFHSLKCNAKAKSPPILNTAFLSSPLYKGRKVKEVSRSKLPKLNKKVPKDMNFKTSLMEIRKYCKNCPQKALKKVPGPLPQLK